MTEIGSQAPESRVSRRIADYRRRQPRLIDERITSAHGAGGQAQADVVGAVFLDAYGNDELARLDDGAIVEVAPGVRIALSTDAFVVTPRTFPGGSIGRLAVCGTVNDVAVMGARPTWLSIAYVLEEGFAAAELREVAADVGAAAAEAGVAVVTGDTKVVQRGGADGLYVTTAGIGVVPPGRDLRAEYVQPGDRLLISGPLGDHGVAVMLARGELGFDADVVSDCAPLTSLVEAVLTAAPGTRWLRDVTRGGLASACCELAAAAGCAVLLAEDALPVRPQVRAACELLGIDPLYVANEGKVLAVVPAAEAAAAEAAARKHPLGAEAMLVGEIGEEPVGLVLLETAYGGSRIVDMLVGDPLPRIC